jgi:hypothetical protein
MAAQQTRTQARAAVSASSPVPPTAAAITGQSGTNTPSTSYLPPRPSLPDARRVELPEDFAQALHGFSDQTNRIVTRTHRAGAVLRLIQAHYMEGNTLEKGDMAELLDLLTETLPHHYADVNDPLDEFETTARRAVQAAIGYGERLGEILDAMTMVARGDASLADIEKAAGQVFNIARADAAYLPDWQRMTDALESRGFVVTIETVGDTILGPSVDTAETLLQRRKTKRAVASLVSAANAASEQKSRRIGGAQPQGMPA